MSGNRRERLPRRWERLSRKWRTKKEVRRDYGKEGSGTIEEDRTLTWESEEENEKKAGKYWEDIGEKEEEAFQYKPSCQQVF